MVVDVVIADPQPDDDRIARYLCQPEPCPAVGAGEAPGHRVVPADPVDAQGPGPRCSASMCPASRAGRSSSWTAAANILRCPSGRRRRSARKPGVRTYFTRPSRGQPAAHPWSRTPSVWRIIAGTGWIPCLVNGPVQLGLSLLQRLQRAILLQRDHNRFDLTSADDHLMISNLVAGGNGTLTHAQSIPRQLVPMPDPLTPP